MIDLLRTAAISFTGAFIGATLVTLLMCSVGRRERSSVGGGLVPAHQPDDDDSVTFMLTPASTICRHCGTEVEMVAAQLREHAAQCGPLADWTRVSGVADEGGAV